MDIILEKRRKSQKKNSFPTIIFNNQQEIFISNFRFTSEERENFII